MTQKQKELRKKRVKDILLKTLHVVSYILSLLFILVCIFGVVKSCDNKIQSVSAEEDKVLPIRKRLDLDLSQYNVYVLKSLGSDFTIPLATQRHFLEDSGIDIDIPSSYYRPEVTHGVYLPNGSYISFGNDFYELKSIDYLCHDFKYSNNDYYRYLINSIRIISRFDGVYHINELVHKADSNATSYTYNYTNQVDFKIITTEDVSDDYFINFFYKLSQPSNFIFNKQFNFNAPIGLSNQSAYGSGLSWSSSTSDTAYIDYDTGYFVSNGLLFNKIRIYYWSTNAMTFDLNGEITAGPQGQWSYSFLYYINTDTNTTTAVNHREQLPYKTSNGGYGYYQTLNTIWINDSFRYITFLQPLSDSLSIKINSFNNNNQTYYSGQIYTEGGDVFTLLSYGFSSLSDFWSINILPGISIGVLFFLPAVVGIIITIVHLLRK